jgi:hypothetical protein
MTGASADVNVQKLYVRFIIHVFLTFNEEFVEGH